MFTYQNIFKDKTKVLFVTAHPDDVDVFFGGLIGLLNKDHKDCFVLVTTNGARGSKNNVISEAELAGIRLNEEKSALSFLKQNPSKVISLNYLDGEIDNNFELIGRISGVIRKFQPDIVCTHEPNSLYFTFHNSEFAYINHRDHRTTGSATLDAVYPFCRDKSFFPEQNLESWEVKSVLLTGEANVNTKINITSVIDQKRRALLAHKSQFTPEIIEGIISRGRQNHKYYETANYLQIPW
jgi:LmbE family N-acetylglucosaminyl deacetylase